MDSQAHARKMGDEAAQFENSFATLAKKIIQDGIKPEDALGINPNSLERIYSQAYRLYGTGKYLDALQLFRVLVMMKSMEIRFQLGLAACLHMIHDYENAVQIYTLCSLLDPNNPLPHYHSYDCFLHLDDSLSAMLSLEQVLIHTENKPEFIKLRERAALSLTSLKEKQKTN